jgi:glycine betaine/proline transport system ATP-binding protein
MVFQNFALFPHRNILNNVEYGLEIQQIDKKIRQEKAKEVLKLVGLEGWEEAMPSQLSGGMQQRVGLARALAVDPDILLMDEAFSALDPLIRNEMQNELMSLQARMKKTILFITHDLDEALKLGDRVVMMKDGQIIQIGTPEEIILSPTDNYVKRFIENVDKSKVLTAQSVLTQAHKIIAYPDNEPDTVLFQLRKENLPYLFIVQRNNTLIGIVQREAVRNAVERGDKSIANLPTKNIPTVTGTTPLKTLIALFAKWSGPLPVVDVNRQVQGMVDSHRVLVVLAQTEKD